jgi:hypothetical protein
MRAENAGDVLPSAYRSASIISVLGYGVPLQRDVLLLMHKISLHAFGQNVRDQRVPQCHQRQH